MLSARPCASTLRAPLRRLVERGPQLEPQLGADRLQQVVRRLAAGELQVAAGALRQVQDVVFLVDHDRRRRVLLEQPLVQLGERTSRSAPAGLRRAWRRRQPDARRDVGNRQHQPRRTPRLSEEVGVLVDR